MSSDISHGVPHHHGIGKPRVWVVEDAALPPVVFNVQCSKYFTLEEKNAALRKQKASYSRTERGKAARQIQNARAKAKLCGRKRTTGSLSNAKPLPHASPPQLISVSSSILRIGVDRRVQCKKPPPYDSPPPPNSPDEDRFTRNLADVMHGRQYRLEKETRARYAQIFATANAEVILQDIQAAERTLLGKWNELNEVAKDIG
ncbi:hypothetical protein BDR05DRAFT_953594 [Suillus weaverae]|nr:hypothetical protein BDR05DRAFT_953594 [Suillus weaverae]